MAALALLLIPACGAYVGAVPTHIYGHDIFVLLDGGWRVLNGQRPLLDFSPGVGPLAPLIFAAGLGLSHWSVNGVGYATAMIALIAGFWTYALARSRMAWLPAVLVSALLSMIAAAPFPVGDLPNRLTHAMAYNRYGYALLGVIVVEAFMPLKDATNRAALPAGMSSGALVLALVFLKPSYGLVGLVFILASVVLRWSERTRMAGTIAGVAVTFLALMIYLRFDFSAVWNGFGSMAAARSAGLSVWFIRWAFLKGLKDFLWLGALAALVTMIARAAGAGWRAYLPLVIASLVFSGEALLLATNAQLSGYPLNALVAVLFAEQARILVRGVSAGGTHGLPGLDAIAIAAGVLCFLPVFAPDAGGLVFAMIEKARLAPESQVARLRPPQLAPLLLYDFQFGTEADERSNGRTLVRYVNDGVQLIERFSPPGETVYTLDFSNPFSYALLRRPPHGGMSCLDFDFQFSDHSKPSADWLFGGADVIMVPKHPTGNALTRDGLARIYLGYVQRTFRLCAQSDWWALYKRPFNLAGCSIGR